ncbi:unnamed protein product [Clonostachys rosea]|uniref:S-adenosyl-L-methionine-dependent N-methyltransferase n=1 Tax=Bionectria ochroleuca TaxID=29856 RepID=A0ABY6UIY3_BIOOC|nr:unnamed protein product [Clonostachys rosea]
MARKPPSLAVFCPQTRAPQEDYLSKLRTFICSNRYLRRLVVHIQRLSETWEVLAHEREDIATLAEGPKHVQALSDWITHGHSKAVANGVSGILCMPLLTIVEISQYFQFLEAWDMSHSEVLSQLQEGRGGGVQGYCAGLLPAFAVATSRDEDEIIERTAIAIRVGLVIGACTELGDDMTVDGTTTLVVRLKYGGQADDIVNLFPGSYTIADHAQTYIGAITDPKTVGIVGPATILKEVARHVEEQGMIAQPIHLRGKNHNPENTDLANALCNLCDQHQSLQLPHSDRLQVKMSSNRTSRPLANSNLTHEAIRSMLSSSCDWYKLLQGVASDLKSTERAAETQIFALFGIGDPVPLGPFLDARLRSQKVEILKAVEFSLAPEVAYSDDAIAVIGAACRLPGADNLEELWNLIAKGASRCEPVRPERVPLRDAFRMRQSPDLPKKTFYGNFIDDVESFEHAFFKINLKEAASMDPQQRILLEIAYQALDSSGYLRWHQRDQFDNVGCFIGASSCEYHENTSAHGPTAYTATGTLRAFLSGKISYNFGWSGPAENIDTACSSSLVAIHRGCQAIITGECSMALAGGVNVLTGVNHYMDLAKAGFLSPTGQCKPFDESADGYCRADGAGLVVLKKLGAAIADGDLVLGVLPGVATNQGGLSSTLTVPHSLSQTALYRQILEKSGMTPENVTYVEAHGPGTQAGDPIEISGIRQVLGGADRISPLHVGSLKGNIGHTEAAAGVAGLLKVLVMLKKGKIPPLASHKTANPKLGISTSDKIIFDRSLRGWNAPVRVAVVNSYGAGGSNAALLCCEPPARSSKTSENESVNIPILISAMSKESLLLYCKSLAEYLDREPISLGDLAYTLAERRQHHRFRWSITVSNLEDLRHPLRELQASRIVEVPQQRKGVVLVFSGQTKRSVGLDKALYDTNALFRQYIDRCNAELLNMGFQPIIPAIFDHNPIDDVTVLQNGTFAVQYASARCWIDNGLKVSAVIGHSFGELTALVISGSISFRDGLRLVALRASIMASKWSQERGVMLSVLSSREILDELIAHIGEQEVEIACFNADNSTVLVASAESASRAEHIINTNPRFRGVQYRKLDVSHGFHSRFTEPLLQEILSIAQTISFRSPDIRLETCTSEASGQVLSPTHVVSHTRKPVYFAQAVRRIENRLGPCVWLEAGVDSSIISMVRRAVKAKDHFFQAVSSEKGRDARNSVGSATANLWVNGADTSFLPFSNPEESGMKHIWLPPYTFNRTRAWLENVDRATEIQRAVQSKPDSVAPLPPPTELVSLATRNAKSAEFQIHVATKRFGSIVAGHAVRRRPLCPASLYMECAAMAAHILTGAQSLKSQTLYYDDLHFQSPLGVDLTRNVSLTLESAAEALTWKFSLNSLPAQTHQTKPTTHAKGKLRFGEHPVLEKYQGLVFSQMAALSAKPDTETLMATRAYGLFSQVVTYANLFKGISSITMDGNHASAIIKVPTGHIGENESTVCRVCDTVSLDIFVQVVGLLINSSDNTTPDDCFVAGGIKTSILSGVCDFTANKSWTVYARYNMINANKAEGEVFVMKPDYTISAVFQGISFSKVAIAGLEELLDSVNTTLSEPRTKTPNVHHVGVAPGGRLTNGSNHKHEAAPPITSSHMAHLALDAHGESFEEPAITTSTTRKTTMAGDIIKDISGADISTAESDQTLTDLGFDSLAIVQLKNDLEDAFSVELDDLHLGLEIGELLQLVGAGDASSLAPESAVPTKNGSGLSNGASWEGILNTTSEIDTEEMSVSSAHIQCPTESLLQSAATLSAMAIRCGYVSYWNKVAPRQAEIVIICILEAFKELGVNIWTLKSGAEVSPVKHLPRHKRLLERFYHILQKHGVIEREKGGRWIRGTSGCPEMPSAELIRNFAHDFPHYSSEAKLISITGSRLADCLSGKTDAIQLLFNSRESQEALEDFYCNSPMLATATELLVDVVQRSIAASTGDTVRILEIGAGFGGTTKRLIEAIEGLGPRIEYTFTDIAPTLVTRASKLFGGERGVQMKFKPLNIERDPPAAMKGQYDLVISTNCVHATRDKSESIVNIKSLLNTHGFIILSEVTEVMDWYDIVWGLLDSWWLSQDKSYAIEPPEAWMQRFRKAGLSATYSEGPSRDLSSQRLLIASLKPLAAISKRSLLSQLRVNTVVYRKVDDVDIHADIFMPEYAVEHPMAIALMIHGGGHMTLSRNAIRPAQTAFLVANGVLPVSLDFRLCPEVNFIDGAMVDIREAYLWAQEKLPGLVQECGISLDISRIAVVGWSTGGHLAMTTAWSVQAAGVRPPKVILSFYSPTDFESGDLDGNGKDRYPTSSLTMAQVIEKLPKRVVTGHEAESNKIDDSGLAWLKPGDARSELVLSLLNEGNGLPLLLNGISNPDFYKRQPHPDLVKVISPMAQVKNGKYKTPTYIVHGVRDEVVPYDSASKFVQALRDHEVECGFLTIEGGKHIHDMDLKPGTISWEAQVAPAYEFLFRKLRE